MCDLIESTDPLLYEARQRSFRINGVITSIRLENLVWDVLAEIAHQQGCTTSALISRFHKGLLIRCDGSSNFTSFLRVTCLRHLRRQLESGISAPGEILPPVPSKAWPVRH
jgi:predicted DNA-binding ribbon-helix-helix protein